MNEPAQPALTAVSPPLKPVDDRLLGWIGLLFRVAALAGLAMFGGYIALRATGATFENFGQWQALLAGRKMLSASDWISNVGIGMHFLMGTVLVLAWPIMLSTRIRTRHRAVHRWTGRVYVTSGFLAGAGGMSFILTRGSFNPAASIAFGIWGAVMMSCAVMAYVNARAKRFDRHRAWAIRLFAAVLGSWLFDVELQAWNDLTGGLGTSADSSGPFDYAMLYLFFVPNLLVAEFFIRNKHKRLALPGHLKWLAVTAFAAAGLVFCYAIVAISTTNAGKFGKHLLSLLGG